MLFLKIEDDWFDWSGAPIFVLVFEDYLEDVCHISFTLNREFDLKVVGDAH